MLIVTLGCAVWNALAMLCQTPSRGWVLPLFHQVRVTLAEAAEVLAGELTLAGELLLHAAIVTAAATAMTTVAGFLEPRIRLIS
jgi:hypothetical protein